MKGDRERERGGGRRRREKERRGEKEDVLGKAARDRGLEVEGTTDHAFKEIK